MAKTGLSYYQAETDRFQDIKVKRLKKRYGCEGYAVYQYIQNEIYRVEGCYIRFTDDQLFDVSEYWGIEEQRVEKIIEYCTEVELFDTITWHTNHVRKYSINSLVYWVTYVHNVVYSFYRSMIYCYINSTQRCAGSIVIDIIPTNGADKRKFFPFAPYFPVTNVIKRYFYPYFPAIIGIKGYSFPYFPYLSGIMKIKTALYSLFSRLDWHKTVVFPCLGEIYEGIRSLSWEIPVT